MRKNYAFKIITLIFSIMFCQYTKAPVKYINTDRIYIFGPQGHISGQQNEVIINFKDSNLELGIREKINKPKGEITKDDVKSIEELTLKHKNIFSLEGIEGLTNLRKINLH